MERTTRESQIGLVFCACWNDHISLKWQRCTVFLFGLMTCLSAGLLLPYLTMVIRNLLPPLLPLVSDAGGLPPSSGIFAVFLILASFFAFITFTIVYVTINHLNGNDKKIIRIANRYGFIIILISSLGLVVTGCYPVGYTDVPNMLEWVMTVLGVHSLGAVMILVGVALYQYCLAAVWWYLPCASKREKYIKLFFICVYTAFFITISYPLPKMIEEVMGPDVLNFERMRNTIYDLPHVYTISRLICSTTEYSICILSIVNFGFFYKYLQKVSLRIVLRHKSCTMEPEDPVPSIKLKPIS